MTATLPVKNDIWNNFPKVKRVIKLPSSMPSASWIGSHLTNDDPVLIFDRLFSFLLAGFILCSIIAVGGNAWSLAGDTEGAFGLDGSVRAIGVYIENYDFPPFFGVGNESDEYAQSILRLTLGGRPRDRLDYEVHIVQSLTYFSAGAVPGVGAFDLSSGKTRYRALDETWDWLTEERVTAGLWLDRFNLKIRLQDADVTIGRQAITFGKAYFWNPMDVYLPFDPRQFDRDYKAGVDALRIDIPLDLFSGFTLVGVLGRELNLRGDFAGGDRELGASWYGSSLLGRFYTSLSGWDLALQAGKIYGGYHVAGGTVGEINGLEVRGEAAFFLADNSPLMPPPFQGDLFEDYFTAVAGLGRRFENSLTLEAEYLFNGGGESADNRNSALIRLQSGGILQLGRHLAGVLASYEILPIMVGQVAFIYSLSDSSFQVQPILNLSLSDNADLLMGASLNSGRRPEGDSLQDTKIKSEFGTYSDFWFIEAIVYF